MTETGRSWSEVRRLGRGVVSQPLYGSTPYPATWVEQLCARAHVAYEAAAKSAGWETQERSRVSWESLPEANKEAMRAAIVAVPDGLFHVTDADEGETR